MKLKQPLCQVLLVAIILIPMLLQGQAYSWPESAVYDASNDRYLISNNGSGDIIIAQRTNTNNLSYFCQGANTGYVGMRGLIIVGNTVWAACTKNDAPTYSQVLVGFDATGNVTNAITITGGVFINDVAYNNATGIIYLSDNNNIYSVNPNAGTFTILLQNAKANGLLYDATYDRLLFTDDRPSTGSAISAIDLATNNSSELITNADIFNLDGLTVDNQGNYYVSYWATTDQNLNGHGIFKYDQNFLTSNPLEQFNKFNAGYADIFYDKINDQLVVPEMGNNFVDYVQPNNLVGTEYTEIGIPSEFLLHQNFPNPFNPNTSINYEVTNETLIAITIYDLLGAEIVQLVNQIEKPGLKTIKWDGRDSNGNQVNGGVYVYRLTAGSYSETKKMVFLK